MKKELLGALVSGALIFSGCGGGSSSSESSSGAVSAIDYVKDGFSYANLKGKNFFGLAKENNSWTASVVKFSDNSHTVYQKEGNSEASTENYTINRVLNGCEKGCVDVAIKDKEDNSTINVYIKAVTQDKDKISLVITNKSEDLTSSIPSAYFFFDKEKLENYKIKNPL